jgi:hypothetical protein
MGVKTGVTWKGTYYVRPQAASAIDSSALSPVQLGSANKVVIMAEMTGLLEPKKLTRIDSTLGNFLIAPAWEEARLAASLVFNPSKGIPGASEVYLLPVNPATKAAKNLVSAAAADVITLDSFMYGLVANQIKVKVEAGTNAGKKVTIGFQDVSEIHDDLARPSFTLLYTGAGATASVTIDVASGAGSHKLTTTTETGGVENLTLDFDSYPTVQSLIDALNASGVFTAVALTKSAKTDLCLQLDAFTAQSVKTTAATITSDLQAIVDRLNERSSYVAATRIAGAGAVPANSAWAYLAGGADGATTNDDWVSAFNELKTVDIDIIVPLVSSASIHALGDAHCNFMSGPAGKSERRQVVGGALQSWTSEANRITAIGVIKAEAAALNSDRTVHVGLGSKHYDANGVSKLYPAYITAVMFAGIAGGASVVTPLTRKYLNCLGLEVELRNTEIDDLLEAHLAVPIKDLVQGAGFVISRQLTTWAQDADLYRVEFSVGRGADYIAREVRNRHELIIGKPGTPGIDQSIISITNAVLEAAMRDELIVSYDPKATVLRADGVVRYIDYSAQPVLPLNWIMSTYHLLPTKFTVSL